MVEITDEASARAWLEEQPHRVQVWFATRCALRALPGIGFEPAERRLRVAISSFRALLVSGASSASGDHDVTYLERAARQAAREASNSSFHALRSAPTSAAASASSAASAIRSAASAAASAASAAESAAFAARSAADSPVAAIELASSKDTLQVLEWPRLWFGETLPEGLVQGWEWLREDLVADPKTWGFWLEWYEAILNGNPLPWELSFRIATTLTDKDWDRGAAHVAERIAEIRQAFEVAHAVSDLRGSTHNVAADELRIKRGHNNPPELVDEPALVERTTVVWAALDDLEHEATADEPDKAKAREMLGVIRDWFVAACGYLGRKVDLTIDTAIKWAIPTGGGYLMLHPDKMQKVIELSERWLMP